MSGQSAPALGSRRSRAPQDQSLEFRRSTTHNIGSRAFFCHFGCCRCRCRPTQDEAGLWNLLTLHTKYRNQPSGEPRAKVKKAFWFLASSVALAAGALAIFCIAPAHTHTRRLGCWLAGGVGDGGWCTASHQQAARSAKLYPSPPSQRLSDKPEQRVLQSVP